MALDDTHLRQVLAARFRPMNNQAELFEPSRGPTPNREHSCAQAAWHKIVGLIDPGA
ncbi:MAG: hypothetical protein JSR41_25550 [Proteobacteria bacterium]|nr:hypothetical protein [Pseudomonadota bacterium]